ncbi:FliI/YscN family ATPase [Nocardioides sp. WL0053]|uniref:FliI/YscN family ATPase n=1 Tax=Nocardioides jiangsuensis TaxID=2866161 RepID=A0ABS7RHN1_9ACTN|nr:FliI/YscN family ATPase [Nocardioides jiangsuensis]MBY9074034.1 FliI/YscN family ATPase [Nocardioides jiangsuensis]
MTVVSTGRTRVDEALEAARPQRLGRLVELKGLHLLARGVDAAVGGLVEVTGDAGAVPAEVVASTPQGVVCLPLGNTAGLRTGAPVRSTGAPLLVPVGRALQGRVLDGLGRPLDGGPSLADLPRVPVENDAPEALSRSLVDRQVGLGVRALDALVPCGRGQRMSIMAGSGVGKSTLLSMVARGTEAAVSVVALIGERGREVREFIENDLGPEGLARSVVVVATSDAPPVVRLRAAFVATRIAEWFRDAGEDVVLMMDSLTRVAMAQREIGLSAGEPPTTRGYPPSVFAMLPRLLERTGPGAVGSITGLYTVLVEGDDLQDPIGDTSRSILDGHVVLSRRLATGGHYPSIDVLESLSRVAPVVTDREQMAAATTVRRLLAAHRDVRELVEIGAYAAGSDPDADRALALMPRINDFLRQRVDEPTPLDETWRALHDLAGAR